MYYLVQLIGKVVIVVVIVIGAGVRRRRGRRIIIRLKHIKKSKKKDVNYKR